MLLLLFHGRSRLPGVDKVLMPKSVLVNAMGGPMTSTTILKSTSGIEDRKANFLRMPRQYTVAFGPKDVDTLLALFRCQIGPRYGFMMRDPNDYLTFDEVLVKQVRNNSTVCQLTKTYTTTNYFTDAVERTTTRDVLLPDTTTLVVKLNGVTVDPSSYTIVSGGVLVFNNQTFYDEEVLTASFEDFVPVRFMDDQLDLKILAKDVNTIEQTRVIEILPID